MSFLQSIGLSYGTDKSDADHSHLGKSYLDTYDSYFNNPWRHRVAAVLEIGVLRGESLRMWRDYFTFAQVWGLDIDPTAKRDYGPRTHVVTGSQIDKAALDACHPGGNFDLIVDDGSHVVDHIVTTFNVLWSRLNPGGWYVIEDLSLAYGDITLSLKAWPGQHLNTPDTNYLNDRKLLDRLIAAKIEGMDNKTGDVQSVHFHSNLCLIQKAS